jgi:hypothetical protein
VSRVSPAKSNLVILEGNETVIGNGHPMCVSAEVTKRLIGSAEGWFAIDNPSQPVKLRNISSAPVATIGRRTRKKLL